MKDLIIIGSGAAGLTASIYASRYKLNHLIIGKVPGGQMVDAHVVQNYPGFESISGTELTEKFIKHLGSYKVTLTEEIITTLKKSAGGFEVINDGGKTYHGKTLILAMGARHRSLNVPGEAQFLGKGVSYCATCDAPLFKDKTVAVVGGGDSAATAALHLSLYASKVYLIHRRDTLRAEPAWQERLKAADKIELVLKRQVSVISGNQFVESIKLNEPYGGKSELDVGGVFIEIGLVPAASLAKQIEVEVDKEGYIIVGPDMSTNTSGVFAAGDICALSGALHFRQIVTSAAQGASAAAGVYQYLNQKPPAPSWS